MEKLSIQPNGQWQLEKAKPKGDVTPYNMTVDNDFTGKDAKKAQIRVVRAAIGKGHQPHKTAVNDNTGKEELHRLLHRGMKDTSKEASRVGGYNVGIDGKKNKMEHSTHAVHTLDSKSASEYGDVHSFWVPVSHISSMSDYLSAGQGKADPHASAQEHVIVKPGSFSMATKNEMQDMDKRGSEYIQRNKGKNPKETEYSKGANDHTFEEQDENGVYHTTSRLMQPGVKHKFYE